MAQGTGALSSEVWGCRERSCWVGHPRLKALLPRPVGSVAVLTVMWVQGYLCLQWTRIGFILIHQWVEKTLSHYCWAFVFSWCRTDRHCVVSTCAMSLLGCSGCWPELRTGESSWGRGSHSQHKGAAVQGSPGLLTGHRTLGSGWRLSGGRGLP